MEYNIIKRLFYFATFILVLSCNSKMETSAETQKKLLTYGNYYYEKGKFAKAIQFYEKYLINDSLNAEIYFKKGTSNFQLYNYYSAQQDYKKAFELNYREPKYFRNVALLSVMLCGDSNEIAKQLEIAKKLYPSDTGINDIFNRYKRNK